MERVFSNTLFKKLIIERVGKMALQVYTSQYRYSGDDRLDIIVKTSDGTFAPTWEMVKKHKSGEMSDEEYTKRYLLLMQKIIY